MATSADKSTATGSRTARGTRKTQSGETSRERAAQQLRTEPLIAKKRRVARTPGQANAGRVDNSQTINDTPIAKPKKAVGNSSVPNILRASFSEFKQSSSQQNGDLKKEMQALRFEMVEMKEEYIRRSNERKIANENARKDAEAKQDVRFEKIFDLSCLISTDENVQKAGAMREFVKLYTSLEILDPSRGLHIFGGSCESQYHSDDSPAVVEAAKFILGPSASDDDVSQLLNKELSITKKGRAMKQRVGSFAGQVQCRAHDNIRNKMVRQSANLKVFDITKQAKIFVLTGVIYRFRNQYYDDSRSSEDRRIFPIYQGDTLCVGSTASKEEKKECANTMFNSEHYRAESSFEDAWFHAWFAARSEAHSTAMTSFQQLVEFSTESSLPIIPHVEHDVRSAAPISIFALGFILMKITKAIKGVAEIRIRGMRLSHGPAWARECLSLNEKLESNGANTSTEQGDLGTKLVFGKLFVERLMTEEEKRGILAFRG